MMKKLFYESPPYNGNNFIYTTEYIKKTKPTTFSIVAELSSDTREFDRKYKEDFPPVLIHLQEICFVAASRI